MAAELERPAAQASCSTNPLIRKLDKFISLGPQDQLTLDHLCRHRRSIEANATLMHENARLSVVFVVLMGVAYRYRLLADGRRQILGYLMAGDMCDADFIISDRCDHSVGVLTDAVVAVIPIPELKSAIARCPRIGDGLVLASQSEEAVLRRWLLNVGQRHALQRIAHFLCEMSAQLHTAQCLPAGSLSMPLTQHELADTMGLTVVHVNRCLQRLRDEGLIAYGRKRVTIVDRDRLLQIEGPAARATVEPAVQRADELNVAGVSA